MKYRRAELLVLSAAKEIKDGEMCVIGQGVPMAAGAIAKKTHAPNATILTEAGMVDIEAFQNLEDVADPGACVGFSYSVDLFDVFTTIVNRGYADLCMLGIAQIDKFGNVNSTVIGNYNMEKRSDIRLPGSGGANEFAGHCNRTVFTMMGGKPVEKLDYMTTPGWLTGGDSRRKAGLPGGPDAVLTRYGIFRFDETTKEMYLASLFPETSVEDVRAYVPWDLKIAEDFGKNLAKIEPPNKDNIEFLRTFEPMFGISGNIGRRLQSQALPVYWEGGRSNYK